jgi:hypothetical protein
MAIAHGTSQGKVFEKRWPRSRDGNDVLDLKRNNGKPLSSMAVSAAFGEMLANAPPQLGGNMHAHGLAAFVPR